MLVVLDQQGKASQRSDRLAGRDPRIDRGGVGEGVGAPRRPDRVDRPVEPLDAAERLGDEGLGADASLTHRGRELAEHQTGPNGTMRAPSFHTCSMRDS